jgi:CRP/FNR family transcriptional regulator, cyclic AMP receptor protein
MTGRIDSAEVLNQFAVFAEVDPQTRAELAHAGRVERWPAGQLLFQRGDKDDRLIAVISGQIRLSLLTPQGKELVIKVLGPWEVLGELAVLDGLPRSADAQALEQTAAIVFTRERFLGVCARRPDLPLSLARYLSGLLRATNFQMESIALYDLQARLVRFLLFALEQTHGPTPPRMAPLVLGLSQSDLAAVLGASRPRVNNALQDLIANGAVQRDGAQLICDVARLRGLADVTEAAIGP